MYTYILVLFYELKGLFHIIFFLHGYMMSYVHVDKCIHVIYLMFMFNVFVIYIKLVFHLRLMMLVTIYNYNYKFKLQSTSHN